MIMMMSGDFIMNMNMSMSVTRVMIANVSDVHAVVTL